MSTVFKARRTGRLCRPLSLAQMWRSGLQVGRQQPTLWTEEPRREALNRVQPAWRVGDSVETIRLLQNPVISDVWKYLAVVVDIFSLNIPFPMSTICGGFPTNLMHFCNVISRPNQNSKKILRRISRVVGHPCAMKIRTFCAKVLDLPTVASPRRAAHGPGWAFPDWLSLSSWIR